MNLIMIHVKVKPVYKIVKNDRISNRSLPEKALNKQINPKPWRVYAPFFLEFQSPKCLFHQHLFQLKAMNNLITSFFKGRRIQKIKSIWEIVRNWSKLIKEQPKGIVWCWGWTSIDMTFEPWLSNWTTVFGRSSSDYELGGWVEPENDTYSTY